MTDAAAVAVARQGGRGQDLHAEIERLRRESRSLEKTFAERERVIICQKAVLRFMRKGLCVVERRIWLLDVAALTLRCEHVARKNPDRI